MLATCSGTGKQWSRRSNRSTSTASDYDLALILSEGSTQSARLGPEGVPDGLRAGDGVLVTMAANMVVSLPPALAQKRPALPRLVRCQFV